MVVACFGAVTSSGGGSPALATAEQNRAVLVVDTGEQVKKLCVRFWEDSISAAELLRRAEVDAAMRPFAGKGVAVCSLCGVGCRTDDSCLTCDPDGRYWAYSRAPAGTSAFRLSPAGASNTEVRNGDVEGWRWSRGASPGYISVEEVCDGTAPAAPATATTTATPTSGLEAQSPAATVAPGAALVTTTTTTLEPSSGAGAAKRNNGPAVQPSSTSSSMLPTAISPSPSVVPVSPSRAIPADGATDSARDTKAAAARRGARSDGSGSPAGFLAFAAALAGLLGWAAWARRRRT